MVNCVTVVHSWAARAQQRADLLVHHALTHCSKLTVLNYSPSSRKQACKCHIHHSSDALISASNVAPSIPKLWLLTSSQDSPQLQVHSLEYVCSTCVDALNRLWTKILPVGNAATCAQIHVQIVFCSTCSMMVQLCGVPLPCSQLLSPCRARSTDASRCIRARAFRLVAIFLRGHVSCASAGSRSPVSSFLLPLQAGRRSWPMLKSVSSIRRRHAGHDGEVFLWPSGPHRATKKKISVPGFGWASYLPLSFLSDDMTLGHLAVLSQ